MDDLKERNLKEEAPYRTLWSTRFGRGHWLHLKRGEGQMSLQYFFPLRIVFKISNWSGKNKNTGRRVGEMGCMYIKDWFKLIFNLFFTPPPPPSVCY